MNKLIENPYLIFLLSIPLIMLIGILSGEADLDINVHDTYYVISYLHLAILISILFAIISIGYWIMLKTNRKLSKWFNLTHIILTIGGLISLFGISILPSDSNYDSSSLIFDDLAMESLLRTLIILLMIFGQLIYIINLIIGIFRTRKTSG